MSQDRRPPGDDPRPYRGGGPFRDDEPTQELPQIPSDYPRQGYPVGPPPGQGGYSYRAPRSSDNGPWGYPPPGGPGRYEPHDQFRREDPARYHRRAAMPPPPPRPKPTPGGVIIGRILATVVSVALLAVSGIAWSAVGGTPDNASDATNQAGSVGVTTAVVTTTDADGNVITVPVSAKGTNILIVGSDARTDADGNRLSPEELKAVSTGWDGGGISTDTLMILHVPGNGAKATALSIPRDTWLDDSITQAPGVVGPYSDGSQGPYKANKVNSFYGTAATYEREYLVSQGISDEAELHRRSSEAGRTMLIKVLQQFTGIKIDHYAEINLIGFYLLSDAIGGVPVCLLEPVKDRQSGADFPAGEFTVAGSEALSFVRQRHGLPGGDLDRIRRQQAFLASAANQILSASTLTNPRKLSDLVSAANRSLVLDNGFDLLSFAKQVINLSSGNIELTTIPTHGTEMIDGKSALAVDPAEVRAVFAKLMTDPEPTTPTTSAAGPVARGQWTVDVQNGTETAGMAAQSGAVVAAAGFQRGQLSDYPGVTPDNQQAQTTVRYPVGGEEAAQVVASILGVGTAVADDSVAAGHLLVVVGTDMPVLPADQIPSVPIDAVPTSATAPEAPASTEEAINAARVPCIH